MAEPVIVRDAEPAEFAAIGELRVGAYAAGSFLADTSNYGPTLRTLATDGTGQILAAAAGGQLLGTVTLQLPPHAGQVVRGPDEAEVQGTGGGTGGPGPRGGPGADARGHPAGHGAGGAASRAEHPSPRGSTLGAAPVHVGGL